MRTRTYSRRLLQPWRQQTFHWNDQLGTSVSNANLCRTMTTVVRLHKKSLEKHAHSLPFLVRQQTSSPSAHSWHTRTMTRTVHPQNNFIPTDKPEKNHFPMIYPVLSSIWSSWKRRRLSAAYSLFRKSWQLGFFGLIQIWQKVFTSGFPPLLFLVFALHGL